DILQPFCRDISNYEVTKYTGGTKFRNGDTIMARITPCLENGKTAKINILDTDEIGFGSTEYIVLRAIPNISNEDFIYYLTCSPIIREPAIKSMVGSSGRQRVQINVLQNLEINLPPLETQKKIASILSALDDKIELNNKINENLEMQAQAIFKSWFVDFEPFGGVMPEDWKMGNLLDIADYLNGLAMQKFKPNDNENSLPVLKIKELRQGFCDNTSDLCSKNIKNEYIIHDGDVIFSWSGSLLVDFWCGGICGLNQHLFKVSSRKYDKWFYYSWTQYHLQKFISIAKDMATTMGHIKREELKKSEVLIPNNEDYLKLDGLLSPIYNKIIINRIENKRLAELRDTLLPKLMNGEIDVDDVQV
ncbi:MAG: restriction endonuclease subunit S, partial [Oscillospiraceae bacterium]